MRKFAFARAAIPSTRSPSAAATTGDPAAIRSRGVPCRGLAPPDARTQYLAGVFGLMVAASFAAPALAADLPVPPSRRTPAVPSEFSWAGSHVGVNLGDTRGAVGLQASSAGAASPLSASSDGALIGGFQSGYNWQFEHLVFGLEGDTQFTRQQPSVTVGAPFGSLQAGDTFKVKTEVTSSSRAKVGWASDRFLVYGTGGLATALIDVSASYGARGSGSPAFEVDQNNKFRFGYTVGAGVEYAVSDRASLGLEYRYTDLGHHDYDLGALATVGDLHLTSSTVTARFNIKFDGFGLLGGLRSP
jgi:outer membrane immunogenic protein